MSATTEMDLPPGWERPKISDSILDHIGCTPLVRINNVSAGVPRASTIRPQPFCCSRPTAAQASSASSSASASS
eukprot:scaffold120965_cov63-Phaeocystis_antarctica.AAC.2